MPATLTADDVALILDTVIEGENQYDGNGETGADDVTLAEAIRTIYAACGGADGTNLNTDDGQAVVKSIGGGRNRIVANLVNGNRSVTSRDGS